MYDELCDSRGEITLFSLMLPRDSDGRWDLIVSAQWLPDALESYQFIAASLKRFLSKSDMARIGRIVIIDANDPAVTTFVSKNHDAPGAASFVFAGVSIARAQVFHPRNQPQTLA